MTNKGEAFAIASSEPLSPTHRQRLDRLLTRKDWRGRGSLRPGPSAREGAPMTAADLAKFEPQRRYATLAALAIEGRATVIDEIIDLRVRQQANHTGPRKDQRFRQDSWSSPCRPPCWKSPPAYGAS